MTISFVIIGPEKSGKTQLFERLSGKDFNSDYIPTIVPQQAQISLNGTSANIAMWELPADVKYNEIVVGTPNAILVCVDLMNEESLAIARERLPLLRGTYQKIPIVLIGTKYDLEYQVKVWPSDLDSLGEEYILASAKTKNGIDGLKYWLSNNLKPALELPFHKYLNIKRTELDCLITGKKTSGQGFFPKTPLQLESEINALTVLQTGLLALSVKTKRTLSNNYDEFIAELNLIIDSARKNHSEGFRKHGGFRSQSKVEKFSQGLIQDAEYLQNVSLNNRNNN